jgi:hypothetical protein
VVQSEFGHGTAMKHHLAILQLARKTRSHAQVLMRRITGYGGKLFSVKKIATSLTATHLAPSYSTMQLLMEWRYATQMIRWS